MSASSFFCWPRLIAAAIFVRISPSASSVLVSTAAVLTAPSSCIGTVLGDLHDIGKNLVKIMFEGSGIEVYDLGADVPPEKFIETAKEHDCDIIACSSLLTTTMQEMRQIVELAKQAGIRDTTTIMVGGAPISQSFCDEIGADIYTPDAASAARAAVKVLTL